MSFTTFPLLRCFGFFGVLRPVFTYSFYSLDILTAAPPHQVRPRCRLRTAEIPLSIPFNRPAILFGLARNIQRSAEHHQQPHVGRPLIPHLPPFFFTFASRSITPSFLQACRSCCVLRLPDPSSFRHLPAATYTSRDHQLQSTTLQRHLPRLRSCSPVHFGTQAMSAFDQLYPEAPLDGAASTYNGEVQNCQESDSEEHI
jgi:hypothetical protein